MTTLPQQKRILASCLLLLGFLLSWPPALVAQDAASSPAATSKVVGVVQSVNGAEIVLKTDNNKAATVQVGESTRILRSAPEQKSLRDATPAGLSDIQAGDRVLAAGKSRTEGTLAASTIVVMKHADIARKQQQDLQDWQRRGVGGLVMSVDTAAGIVKIGTSSLGQKREVAVQVSSGTIIRRYARDSVKFQDTTTGTLDQIKPGDQLRARGNRSEDGSQLLAEEIVSGSFRNISGEVSAQDAAAGTITVRDLATKKPVVVKITPESQMRKLPEMMARMLAARLKGEPGMGRPGAEGAAGSQRPPQAPEARPGLAPAGAGPGGPSERPGNGDLQSMLNRAPSITIADIHKGDAVMVVTTEGTESTGATAITLLSGVEPVLTASPSASFLSPWNLNAGGGEGGGESGTQ